MTCKCIIRCATFYGQSYWYEISHSSTGVRFLSLSVFILFNRNFTCANKPNLIGHRIRIFSPYFTRWQQTFFVSARRHLFDLVLVLLITAGGYSNYHNNNFKKKEKEKKRKEKRDGKGSNLAGVPPSFPCSRYNDVSLLLDHRRATFYSTT